MAAKKKVEEERISRLSAAEQKKVGVCFSSLLSSLIYYPTTRLPSKGTRTRAKTRDKETAEQDRPEMKLATWSYLRRPSFP